MCWIQGDPYPSKTPIYIEGNFGAIDRGFNLYGNSISSVIVTANVANTKILDIDIDVQVPDGPGGVKGQKGQKGQPGVQGAQGVQGFAGLSGHQGVQGAQGLAGLKGDVGEVVGGTKGAKGDKGEFGYGEVGDDGEKGQKGESIGATKGEKGAKGEKGGLGDAGVNASTPSNNISSISISNQSWAGGTIRLYTLNFTNPLPSSSYSVVGSSRKPNSSETGFFYSGSGHLQTYLKDTNYTQVAFAVSGENINNTQYFIPADGSVIIVGDIVAASSVEITNVTASNFSLAGIGGSATATYRLASSGGAFRTISSGTLTAISGQWLLSGSASNYEAFVSVNSGGTGTPGGTFDTWVNLGTTQNWTLTSENSFSTTTFTVQIRNAATLAVVDTAQVTMEVDSAP